MDWFKANVAVVAVVLVAYGYAFHDYNPVVLWVLVSSSFYLSHREPRDHGASAADTGATPTRL